MRQAVPSALERLLALVAAPAAIASPSDRSKVESRWQEITTPHALFLVLMDCIKMFREGDGDTKGLVRDSLTFATARSQVGALSQRTEGGSASGSSRRRWCMPP